MTSGATSSIVVRMRLLGKQTGCAINVKQPAPCFITFCASCLNTLASGTKPSSILRTAGENSLLGCFIKMRMAARATPIQATRESAHFRDVGGSFDDSEELRLRLRQHISVLLKVQWSCHLSLKRLNLPERRCLHASVEAWRMPLLCACICCAQVFKALSSGIDSLSCAKVDRT